MSTPSYHDLVNTIRFLSIDAVEKAQSGHPGMPLGMADIATVLWKDFLSYNPANPHWINRDRFVLSNGHGSMLLYALLYLTGYDLSLEDLKNFRQLHSRTPGHPEIHHTLGVETTTGPLGQGLANAIGMALAERVLAAHFNQEDCTIIDHYTYVFAGDGCLMEGISHEVCSLAGTLGLGKLLVFWDNNGISIDGKVEAWFTENIPLRFKAYGWHVIDNIDGHQPSEIQAAIREARHVSDKPSLLCCKTVIGYGSPQAGTEKVHGMPLGAENAMATRAFFNWPYAPFEIPPFIQKAWYAIGRQGISKEEEWQKKWKKYQKKYPFLAKELLRRIQKKLPEGWDDCVNKFLQYIKEQVSVCATRKASQYCLNAYAPLVPELIGGSADLKESNLTEWDYFHPITASDYAGNYIFYGVREFGMSAMMTGMALHGGFIPYGGTFLVFSDYARNAIRMAALMQQQIIFIYTHDSIGLGEDGPTHQPVEHLPALRYIPNLSIWRPCDRIETAIAWKQAIQHTNGPTCLVLTRQSIPPQNISNPTLIEKGGYILWETALFPIELILIATGSEVSLAMQAAHILAEKNIGVRVVSMPSTNVFDTQPIAYQESILLPFVKKRLAIEAAAPDFWYKYVGLEGKILGLKEYGKSAPGAQVFESFGFTVEHIIDLALEMRGKNGNDYTCSH